MATTTDPIAHLRHSIGALPLSVAERARLQDELDEALMEQRERALGDAAAGY